MEGGAFECHVFGAMSQEEQVYELEPGKPKTLEELVQLYVELTAAWS